MINEFRSIDILISAGDMARNGLSQKAPINASLYYLNFARVGSFHMQGGAP
jgi:hypothetical protein